MSRNVVFMGTPDFAVGTLEALIASDGYRVTAVFSQPDKPKGRSKTLQAPPVKEIALAAGIPVFQPVRIREPEWLLKLQELQPDVIVVVAFGQIIPQAILDLPKYGCINVHASLLPMYRGAAPIQWAVINGDRESGVTTMRMDAGLDTGDMIMTEKVTLAPDETGGSLFDRLSDVGAKLLIRTLDAVFDGTAQYVKQPAESPTPYASMLTKQDGEVDWTQSAAQIECRIRGLDPWPGTWTKYRGRTLKLWKAQAEPADGTDAACTGITDRAAADGSGVHGTDTACGTCAAPGTVVEVTKTTLKVRTGQGILSVLELQPEGKKRMDVASYLRGNAVAAGDVLGS